MGPGKYRQELNAVHCDGDQAMQPLIASRRLVCLVLLSEINSS
jgi:hypothetical protein